VRGAYLGADDARPPSRGFSGLISISGGFQGSVYVSAPRAMLRHLLVTAKEPSQSDRNLLDLVGEVANTVAGNACRYFGERMEIAVPVTIAGHADTIRPCCRARLTSSWWNGRAIRPSWWWMSPARNESSTLMACNIVAQ